METDSNNLKPIYIPVKCVVCNGFGTVNWGRAQCHACNGRGYILVSSGKEMERGERKDEGNGT